MGHGKWEAVRQAVISVCFPLLFEIEYRYLLACPGARLPFHVPLPRSTFPQYFNQY